MMVLSILRKVAQYPIFKGIVIMTLITIAFSVSLTLTIMTWLNASWLGVGTFLAIICPLLGTPPIIYVFLKLQKTVNQTNHELQKALSEVKVLSGLLPICANCKQIKDEQGIWEKMETYITKNSEADFSHSICPCCKEELYGDFLRTNKKLSYKEL